MHLDQPASLEDRWLDIFRELGEPVAVFVCTFAFHAEFFRDLLARFADASCEGAASTERPFTRIPIDVVCDRSRYNGHRIGFNVTLWPKTSRLFHPKLLIALFPDQVVWSDGSLNLTPAGWRRNRELTMLHRPGRLALPRELRELMQVLHGVAAARCILDATSNEQTAYLPGRYLTSLSEPIGTRFLSGAPKDAEEVHLVAPFFERDDSGGAPLDDRWLRLLAQRYPRADFHVYLPELEAEPSCVQGCREIFEILHHQLSGRMVLHPVAPEPGPLHGKIVCVVHAPGRIRRAHILIGSPNMTHAALLAPPFYGNVESAWILDEPWHDVKRLFRSLRSPARSIDDIEFVPPEISRVESWMPLRRATYDPLRRELWVEWKDATDAHRTIVRYAGRALSLGHDGCDDFDLVDGIVWLTTHKRDAAVSPGCCPIELLVELLPACDGHRLERTPEEWLRMLGALSADALLTNGHDSNNRRGADLDQGNGFKWSERVRDLAARMRYFENTLGNESLNQVEREWLLKLFFQIYDSHNPLSTSSAREQIWRAWVRIELWRAPKNLATVSPTKMDRAEWRARTQRLRRRLGISKLAPTIRSQIRVAVRELGRSL